MNVYSELLELLTPSAVSAPTVLFGTLCNHKPVTVEIDGTQLQEGLVCNASLPLRETDIGKEVALLPCADGFLILCYTEGGSA